MLDNVKDIVDISMAKLLRYLSGAKAGEGGLGEEDVLGIAFDNITDEDGIPLEKIRTF